MARGTRFLQLRLSDWAEIRTRARFYGYLAFYMRLHRIIRINFNQSESSISIFSSLKNSENGGQNLFTILLGEQKSLALLSSIFWRKTNGKKPYLDAKMAIFPLKEGSKWVKKFDVRILNSFFH